MTTEKALSEYIRVTGIEKGELVWDRENVPFEGNKRVARSELEVPCTS